MSEHTVLHSTFTLERTYPTTPERVFAAWADPAAKAQWFAGADCEHELDFRVHGRETVRRPGIVFDAVYHDIVPGERIVFAATLSSDGELATVSLTTVQFAATTDGTGLLLSEQGTFLDGKESPEWREQGTNDWLDKLVEHLI